MSRLICRKAAGGETPPVSTWLESLKEALCAVTSVKLTMEEDTDTLYVSFYSRQGEEINVEVNKVDYPYDVYKALYNAYEEFDVDDHVMDLLDAKRNGVSGIPGVQQLVADAEMIEATLDKLADKAYEFDQAWKDDDEEGED